MQQPLWAPKSSDSFALADLQAHASVGNYWDLHRWSIDSAAEFWKYVFVDCKVVGDSGAISAVGDQFFTQEFFPEAQLNVVDTLLQGEPDQIVITEISETGQVRKYSRSQVREITNQVAAGFQQMGLIEGDVVAAITSNVAEVAFFALGALKIGAIFSSTSPDFGTETILDRFVQISPKALLVSMKYQYNGKDIDCTQKMVDVINSLPSVQRVLTIESVSHHFQSFESWISEISNPDDVSVLGKFDRPGFILFSSGTTGKPKCIVHSAAGVLLKVLSEQRYHLDIKAGDQIFYHTTCGWMMWNWLIMGLGTGAGITLYDGNPLFPTSERLFDIASKHEITFLGVSAKYIEAIRKLALSPKNSHKLNSLRTIASTGSPLSSAGYKYIYEEVAENIHLASITGGTDICGCFLLGLATLPVYSGQIQVPALGLDISIYNEKGELAALGEKGELVCRNPFPSLPLYFWGDYDKSKYRAAYFEKFSGVWTHGDYVERTPERGYVMHGRSDATLNAGGVRIGTAEIYRIIEQFEEVAESVAVAHNWQGDTRIILFVKMVLGNSLTTELVDQIKGALRLKASPRHVPALVLQAPDLPRTKSNKLVEIAVARAINKEPIDNQSALANPESLDWFKLLNL